MKRILSVLMLVTIVLLGGCTEEQTSENRIYVFSQPGCGHCQNAHAYMASYYKEYDIKELNIREGNNMAHLLRTARRFKVPTETLGTPFIVMGDHYIMGWGAEQQKDFNRHAKNFKPKTKK